MKNTISMPVLLLTFAISISSYAKVISSTPICGSAVHQILMKKTNSSEAQKEYKLSGIVEKSSFMKKGSECKLVISMNENTNGDGSLSVLENRTNLMFPFYHMIETTFSSRACQDLNLSGSQVFQQDDGWRKTFHTSFKLRAEQDGRVKITYSQKEGRLFSSGDDLTCTF